MHEFSIAESIRDLSQRLVPPGVRLRKIVICAGPMRAVDPEALQHAWQALMQDSPAGEVRLQVDVLPWRLQCVDCEAEFDAPELSTACACGSTRTSPSGGDELLMTALEVDPISQDLEAAT
jgi:Zn finger protein HypA/HybF involved in hydrogenase expression